MENLQALNNYFVGQQIKAKFPSGIALNVVIQKIIGKNKFFTVSLGFCEINQKHITAVITKNDII